VSDAGLRAEVRNWLEVQWPGRLRVSATMWEATPLSRAWMTKVRDARWAVPRWPHEWFGRAYSDEQASIVEQEFDRAGAPGAGQDRNNLPANTALRFGSDALKKAFGPGLLTGEITMCLLYSEPGAGSDLAGVRTRAQRDGDEFVIDGQKVGVSGAATATFGMLVARTNWDVPKHLGLSFFFFPMKQPGVDVRPLRQVTDEAHFNEVFLTGARVPAANLIGELNDGWRVLQTALAYERSYMGDVARGPRHGERAIDLVALAREFGRLDDPSMRQDLARVVALRRLNVLNSARAKASLEQGTSSPIMSLGKLAMSRILHEEARVRTAILGAAGLLTGDEYPISDDTNFLALNAYFTSIGGGTDQIQRNIIGERVLGLPKEPEADRDVPFNKVRGG